MGNKARSSRSQRGSMLVMFAFLILVVLAFMGLVFDLGRMQNNQAELQSVADAAALAAARQLDNTTAGVNNAVAAAVAAAGSAAKRNYQAGVVWPTASVLQALRFANSVGPNAQWQTANTAIGAPAGMLFVQFNTALTTPPGGAAGPIFMRLLPGTSTSATVSASAVAGRAGIRVTPLAVCALSQAVVQPVARISGNVAPIVTELVEHGFRRGVGYNLLGLNPLGPAALNFIVNPIDPPNQVGNPANLSAPVAAPFVCSGTMLRSQVIGPGSLVSVAAPFPIAALFNQFNSRFATYVAGTGTGACDQFSAPSDSNIRLFNGVGINWWPATANQVATSRQIGGNLKTTAELAPPPPPVTGITTADYGRLWAFAKPVPFAAYSPGVAEPALGYTPFPISAAAKLYTAPAGGAVLGASYSAAASWTPYSAAPPIAPAAAIARVANRRVLHIPLLACPVPANGLAQVLAVGRFFMTVPATAAAVNAEFAGVASAQAVAGPVELLQ